MRTHELKTWPWFWDAVAGGDKTFELRQNDRGFQTHDLLHLKRWNQERQCYSKPYGPIVAQITYVMNGGNFGLKDGWVCMGIKVIEIPNQENEK